MFKERIEAERRTVRRRGEAGLTGRFALELGHHGTHGDLRPNILI